MREIPYVVLRTAALSGHPHDSGQWLVNLCRLQHGEGFLELGEEGSTVYFPDDAPEPLSTPRSTEARLQTFRNVYYRRLRTSGDAAAYFKETGNDFQVALHLFANWAFPKDGIIDLPPLGTKPMLDKHAVRVIKVIEEFPAFVFQNTWGKWGYDDRDIGFLPFEYFDRYGIESWGVFFKTTLKVKRTWSKGDFSFLRWVHRPNDYAAVVGFEIWHTESGERAGWAFVRQVPDGWDLEELFVMPAFRRQGHASTLVRELQRFIKGSGKELTVWVPFADCKREAPETYEGMVRTLRKLGVRFLRTRSRWVAYAGMTGRTDGSEQPVEPDYIPTRPKSIHHLLIAAALSGMPSGEEVPTRGSILEQTDLPSVESGAWGIMNEMRGSLIERQALGLLSDSEERQLARLQRMSYEILRRTYPAPTEFEERVRQIKERLGETE